MPTNTGYKPLEQFDWIILAVKFLKVFLPSQAAAILIENGNPDSVGGFLAMGDANIAAFVAALIVAALNIWKHRAKLDNGMPNFGLLLAAGVASMTFAGCATWTPAVAGKTKIETHYKDVQVDESGAETGTYYEQTVSGPAGSEIENSAQMHITIAADGSSTVDVGQESVSDTTVQAATITQVVALQTQLLDKALTSIGELTALLAPLAAPLIGAHIEAQAAQPAEPNPLLDAVIRGALRPGP